MGTFLLILVAIVVGIAVLGSMSASANARRAEEERAERRAKEEAEQQRLDAFFEPQRADWAFFDRTKVDRMPGFIALNDTGKTFRLATYEDVEGDYRMLSDEQFPITKISSIAISEPTKTEYRTHVDKTPVAVQQKKSTIGRAVVGGVIAGPVGAVVGGISGVGGGSKIEYHETRRTEAVTVKDHAVLVLGTSDFKRPTIRLAFGDNRILNQWSARLWAARGWA